MDDHTFYRARKERDCIARLYEICDLAKVGAAATDTNLDVAHLHDAQCTMFEMIYALALEGTELAELSQTGGDCAATQSTANGQMEAGAAQV